MRMPFGRHRGVDLEDLADSYLEWLRDLPDHRGGDHETMTRLNRIMTRLRGSLAA